MGISNHMLQLISGIFLLTINIDASHPKTLSLSHLEQYLQSYTFTILDKVIIWVSSHSRTPKTESLT